MVEHGVAYSARNFAKSPFRYHKIVKRGFAYGEESNGMNLFLRIREKVKQGLGHLFITKVVSFLQ